MAKDIHVTLSAKKRRALNEVDFAAVIDSLAKCKLEIRDPCEPLKHWSFDCNGHMIVVNKSPLDKFLGDVQIIVGENAQYEREQTELRRANQHYSDEHVRLSKRIVEQEGALASLTQQRDNEREANVVWEQRHTNLKAKLAAKDALLNAAGRDMEVLRERATGFQEELASALAQLGNANEQIADQERRLKNQGDSIAQYQAGTDPVKDYLVKSLLESVDALTVKCSQLAAARNNQRNTIIGHQQSLSAFDIEATRLREEVAEERDARRKQEGVADGLRSALADVTAERDSLKGLLDWADRTRTAGEHPTAHLVRRTQKLEGELATANAELNDLRATLAEGNATTSKVVLTVHANGAVTLDAGESPVTLQGHVWAEGNVTGAPSA
jgi:chromosome segregation ATPase